MKINSQYITKEVINEMSDFFENEGFLQLNDFFEPKYAKEIKKILMVQNFIEENKPMFFKRKTLNRKNLFELEVIKFSEFFSSKYFIEYLESITNFELNINKIKINMYEKSDFTLLNDKNKKEESLKVIYDISDNFTENMGGKLKYIVNNEEILYLMPTFNTLTIIYKSDEVIEYLKYINNLAKDKKIIRVEISFDILEEI